MAESDQAAVTIEVELADFFVGSRRPLSVVIQVRISSTQQQACEMVKEAIQLAIQAALGFNRRTAHEQAGVATSAKSQQRPHLLFFSLAVQVGHKVDKQLELLI